MLPASTAVHRRSRFDTAGMRPEALGRSGDRDLWTRILGQDRPRSRIGFVRRPTTLHFRTN